MYSSSGGSSLSYTSNAVPPRIRGAACASDAKAGVPKADFGWAFPNSDPDCAKAPNADVGWVVGGLNAEVDACCGCEEANGVAPCV